jgi:subtilisin family serine protease
MRMLAVILCLAGSMAAQSRQASGTGQNEFEWRFSIQQNQTVSSTIEAENGCHSRHRFEVETKTLPPFMRLRGNRSVEVNSQSRKLLPVEFDSATLKPGSYEGVVTIRCIDCKRERGCNVDRQLLHIYMSVQEFATAAAFVPERILVLIPFDSAEAVNATAKKLAADHHLEVIEVDHLSSLNTALIVYKILDGSDIQEKVKVLLKIPQVQIAQPDYVYQTSGLQKQEINADAQLKYGPRLIRADRLGSSMAGKGVRIAIVDTGVDFNHPALSRKIVEHVDVTGTGFRPDIHGTLLAGIIASDPKSVAGIAGIAQQSEIVAIEACRPSDAQAVQAECWSLTLAKGLDLAIQKKVRIINMSLGGPSEKLVTRLVDEAVNRGIVVVAAAGNSGPRGQPSYPAALPNVIAVTAVDANEKLYPQATQGDFIDLAAPGVEIVSTGPGARLLISSGTSLATAFVTGVAALIVEQQPQLSPQAIQALMERTAKDLGPPGKDAQFGSGLIDACKAIAQLTSDQRLCR